MYDPLDRLASTTDANGNRTDFTYDGFDRLDTVTYPGSSTEVFTCDALDNVLTRKTRAGPLAIITFEYDTLNRLKTKTPPTGPAVSYGYDLAGRTTCVSDTSAAIPPVATPVSTSSYAASYGYDALNRPTAVAFDPVAAAATSPAAGELVSFGHSYNPVNQRVGQTVTDNTWLDYPTPATKVSYTANPLNQYTAIAVDGGATVNPTYDNNGNLTSDGSYAYAYDPETPLLTATLGGSTATYAYDAQGRRKSRTVGGATTIFVTDADNRDLGISGAAFIAAGSPVLPYSLFGPAISGGGAGTSLLSATARGYVPPISGMSGTVTESSGPVWNA